MPTITFSISQAWAWFLAACAAIITVVNAWKAVREVKHESPTGKQAEMLKLHEERLDLIEERLGKGDDRFKELETGNKVTQKALIALMGHAINGNDVDQLRKAKKDLEDYLVDK